MTWKRWGGFRINQCKCCFGLSHIVLLTVSGCATHKNCIPKRTDYTYVLMPLDEEGKMIHSITVDVRGSHESVYMVWPDGVMEIEGEKDERRRTTTRLPRSRKWD